MLIIIISMHNEKESRSKPTAPLLHPHICTPFWYSPNWQMYLLRVLQRWSFQLKALDACSSTQFPKLESEGEREREREQGHPVVKPKHYSCLCFFSPNIQLHHQVTKTQTSSCCIFLTPDCLAVQKQSW